MSEETLQWWQWQQWPRHPDNEKKTPTHATKYSKVEKEMARSAMLPP